LAEATLTAVQPPPNTGSPQFTIDGQGGSTCLHLGSPRPNFVTVTNLNAGSYNATLGPLNSQCQFLQPYPNFTLQPGVPRTLDISTTPSTTEALIFGAQDVAPGTYNIRVEWTPLNVDCAFGTRLKPGADVFVSLSVGAITGFLVPVAGEFLGPILGVLAGQVLDQGELCSSLPPPMPPITTNLPSESMATWLQLLKHLAWFSVCECAPGTPTPTPPPTPSLVQPTPWIVYPTLAPCSNSDPCVQLQELTRAVRNLQQQITNVYTLEQLVQRYSLPFAYIRGRRFSTLTASGLQPIDRCVGLLIEVTAHPPNKTFTGVPEYITDLGWISVINGDGMIDEIRLTRQATTWLSKLIPSATDVGWGLREGVTVEISELLAEP
jgi:hypothetical protein